MYNYIYKYIYIYDFYKSIFMNLLTIYPRQLFTILTVTVGRFRLMVTIKRLPSNGYHLTVTI